jgi:dihydroorotase
MVQHSYIMLELYKRGLISLEKIAEKMCHNVAVLYGIEKEDSFVKDICARKRSKDTDNFLVT